MDHVFTALTIMLTAQSI